MRTYLSRKLSKSAFGRTTVNRQHRHRTASDRRPAIQTSLLFRFLYIIYIGPFPLRTRRIPLSGFQQRDRHPHDGKARRPAGSRKGETATTRMQVPSHVSSGNRETAEPLFLIGEPHEGTPVIRTGKTVCRPTAHEASFRQRGTPLPPKNTTATNDPSPRRRTKKMPPRHHRVE